MTAKLCLLFMSNEIIQKLKRSSLGLTRTNTQLIVYMQLSLTIRGHTWPKTLKLQTTSQFMLR